MRLQRAEGTPFDSPFIRGVSYGNHEAFPDLSAAFMEVRGWHGLVKSLRSTRCFHVLEGAGRFVVAGKEYLVVPGDVVFVPRGEPHDFTGEMTLFVVHSPAYHPDFIVKLD